MILASVCPIHIRHFVSLLSHPQFHADASKKLTLPVFLGLGLRDYVSLAEPEKQMQKNFVVEDNLTTYDFDTGHWVMMEAPDEVNVQLDKFFAGL